MATPTVYTPKALVDPAQLTAGITVLYTVPAATTVQLTSLILTNDSATPLNVSIYIVESGSSGDDTNILCKDFTLPADGMPYELVPVNSQGITMNADWTIEGIAATADVVTYHISGVELT